MRLYILFILLLTSYSVSAQRICTAAADMPLQASTQQVNAIVPGNILSEQTIVIPVVVHILYNNSIRKYQRRTNQIPN